MILTTERLVLRPQKTQDSLDLFTILGDPQAMRFWGRPPITRLAVVDELIAEQQAAMAEGLCRYWTMVESGVTVGSVDLSLIQDGAAELGFLVRRDRWGLGLASEAVAAAVAHGLNKMGLHRIVAVLQEDNLSARRVLEKTAFRQVERRAVLLPSGEQRLCAFYRRDA
jgi:ribosomal-protein-alanine N-acetyltransferase